MILAPIVFLQVPLRSSSDDLTARGNLTIIGAVTRRQKILHKISRTPCASTRRQDPPRASTRPHALSRARFLLLTSALVMSSLPRHLLTSLPRHLLTSSLTRTLTSVDFDLQLTLIIDFLLELTFCSPGAPYPVFRVDFIFAVYFCIFCF